MYLAFIVLSRASWSSNKEVLLFYFLLNGPILFGTVLVHELGHSLAAQYYGGHVDHILLWPLGGLAYCGHHSGHANDLKIAIAGPLTHIPMASFWVLLWGLITSFSFSTSSAFSSTSGFCTILFAYSVWLNIALMAFNLLLPCYPLDGGRIFANSLLLCGVPPQTAAYIVCVFAFLIAGALTGWGLWNIRESGTYNDIITVLIGMWILLSTFQLFRLTRAGEVRRHPLFNQPALSSAASGGGGAGGLRGGSRCNEEAACLL